MSHVNFFGIPVEGDITRPESRVPQRPLEELAPLMQALLDDEAIEWFGWRQYTPYFNDGEPCVFSVYGSLAVMLRESYREVRCETCRIPRQSPDHLYCPKCGTALTPADDDEDVWEGVEYSGVLGKRSYNSTTKSHDAYEGPDEARYDRCLALENALDSGAFDDVLLGEFGDHAQVQVSRDKITVTEFSHD